MNLCLNHQRAQKNDVRTRRSVQIARLLPLSVSLVLVTGSLLLLQSLPPKRDGQETVDMDVGHSTPSSIPEESEEESAQSTSDPSKKEE